MFKKRLDRLAGEAYRKQLAAEAAGSGSPERISAVVGDYTTPTDSVSSARMVTDERSPTDAGQGSSAGLQDTDYPNVSAKTQGLISDLIAERGSPFRSSAGGSRRSTRRRKYRKTLKTTRRKKTGKQSSRTRLTKRRRNKKRRSTTRKN